MANKLDKDNYPFQHGPSDFQCFGPPAEKDGEFDNCKLADLGCFKQDGQDSNKFYHGCICQSKKDKTWYVFFQWGRTGVSDQFQFVECDSEQEAQKVFAKQLHSKNDKRGKWSKVGGIRTLVAKVGSNGKTKDLYKVQKLKCRTIGLPDARNITSEPTVVPKKKSTKKSKIDIDPQTVDLLRSLSVGTVEYTRSSLEGGDIPTQSAIGEARDVLSAAAKRLTKIGDNLDAQTNDRILKQLTYEMYSRIRKKKDRNVPASKWILSKDNIFRWNQDLDAFESAIHSQDHIDEPDVDPYGGMPLTLEWLSPKSSVGSFIREWMPDSSSDRHANVGGLKITNVWAIKRHGDSEKFLAAQKETKAISRLHVPLFQPDNRPDLTNKEKKLYSDTNTCLLFHGTRSVNVSGILRESLRMPHTLKGVAINGAYMGGGIYGADDFRKSVQYTSFRGGMYSMGRGSISNRGAFMFVKDMIIGDAHRADKAHGYTEPPYGCHSVFAEANYTKTWGYSTLQNNEWVVYSPDSICLRYLVEFGTSSRYC